MRYCLNEENVEGVGKCCRLQRKHSICSKMRKAFLKALEKFLICAGLIREIHFPCLNFSSLKSEFKELGIKSQVGNSGFSKVYMTHRLNLCHTLLEY